MLKLSGFEAPGWYQRLNSLHKQTVPETFKDFCMEREPRLKVLYPFLTSEQIKGKLFQRWKKSHPAAKSSHCMKKQRKLHKFPVAHLIHKSYTKPKNSQKNVWDSLPKDQEEKAAHQKHADSMLADWLHKDNRENTFSQDGKTYRGRSFSLPASVPQIISQTAQNNEKSILKNRKIPAASDGGFKRTAPRVSFSWTDKYRPESPDLTKFHPDTAPASPNIQPSSPKLSSPAAQSPILPIQFSKTGQSPSPQVSQLLFSPETESCAQTASPITVGKKKGMLTRSRTKKSLKRKQNQNPQPQSPPSPELMEPPKFGTPNENAEKRFCLFEDEWIPPPKKSRSRGRPRKHKQTSSSDSPVKHRQAALSKWSPTTSQLGKTPQQPRRRQSARLQKLDSIDHGEKNKREKEKKHTSSSLKKQVHTEIELKNQGVVRGKKPMENTTACKTGRDPISANKCVEEKAFEPQRKSPRFLKSVEKEREKCSDQEIKSNQLTGSSKGTRENNPKKSLQLIHKQRDVQKHLTPSKQCSVQGTTEPKRFSSNLGRVKSCGNNTVGDSSVNNTEPQVKPNAFTKTRRAKNKIFSAPVLLEEETSEKRVKAPHLPKTRSVVHLTDMPSQEILSENKVRQARVNERTTNPNNISEFKFPVSHRYSSHRLGTHHSEKHSEPSNIVRDDSSPQQTTDDATNVLLRIIMQLKNTTSCTQEVGTSIPSPAHSRATEISGPSSAPSPSLPDMHMPFREPVPGSTFPKLTTVAQVHHAANFEGENILCDLFEDPQETITMPMRRRNIWSKKDKTYPLDSEKEPGSPDDFM